VARCPSLGMARITQKTLLPILFLSLQAHILGADQKRVYMSQTNVATGKNLKWLTMISNTLDSISKKKKKKKKIGSLVFHMWRRYRMMILQRKLQGCNLGQNYN
jgi:hypothetical protein